MDGNDQKSKDLAKARLQSRMSQARDFRKEQKEWRSKESDKKGYARVTQAKKFVKNSNKANGKTGETVNKITGMAMAGKEINLSRDWFHLLIIALSILADLFTLLPLVGNFFSIVFSVFFIFLYLINGHFKRRAQYKLAISATAYLLELLGFAINMLPFFTTSALLNYWLVLAERAEKRRQEN